MRPPSSRYADALPAPAVAVLAAVVLVSGLVVVAAAPEDSRPASSASAGPSTTAPVPTAPVDAGDPAALVSGLEAAVQQARTVRFVAVTERTPEGGATEVEARLTGALDVVEDRGRAQVDLPVLAEIGAEGAGEAETAEDASLLAALSQAELRWTEQDLTVVLDGEEGTVERGSGAGGLIERLPDEPLGVLRLASALRVENADAPVDVDGVPTTLVEGAAEAELAVQAGAVAQAPEAARALGELPVQVWVDGRGLPLRVRVTTRLPATGPLPVRTVVTTYDFRGWGEPVDL